MTDSQLQSLVSDYGASDIKEFITKYVHRIYCDPSCVINVSCDFDYNKKEPIEQIHYCTDVKDGLITLVPADDTMLARMYYNKHISIDCIRELECYATVQNEYMKAAIQKAKENKAAGNKYGHQPIKDYTAIANSKNYPPAQ